MSALLKKESQEKNTKPNPRQRREVIAVNTRKAATLKDIIELVCTGEVSEKLRKLNADTANTTVKDFYKHEKNGVFMDGFKPSDMLPGATFRHADQLTEEDYMQCLINSLYNAPGIRDESWGYNLTSSFYMNILLPDRGKTKHSLCMLPIAVAMKYQGKGRFMERNILDYSNEKAKDKFSDAQTIGGKLPNCRYQREVDWAGFLAKPCCGHMNLTYGMRACECNKELIFSHYSNATHTYTSPVVRLIRQRHIRCEFSSAMLQSDQNSPHGASHYLMNMYPRDKSESHLRNLRVPIGMTDEETMAFMVFPVCKPTFRQLFCLTEEQDNNLYRRSQAGEGRLYNTMAYIHQSGVEQKNFGRWKTIQALETIHPGMSLWTPTPTPKTGRKKRKRETNNKFGFNYKALAAEGVCWIGELDNPWTWEEVEEEESDYVPYNSLWPKDMREAKLKIQELALQIQNYESTAFRKKLFQPLVGTVILPPEGFGANVSFEDVESRQRAAPWVEIPTSGVYKIWVDKHYQKEWWSDYLLTLMNFVKLDNNKVQRVNTKKEALQWLCTQPGTLGMQWMGHGNMFRTQTSGYMDDGYFHCGETTSRILGLRPPPKWPSCEVSADAFWLDNRLKAVPTLEFVAEGEHTRKFEQAMKVLTSKNMGEKIDKKDIRKKVYGLGEDIYDRNLWPSFWNELHNSMEVCSMRQLGAKTKLARNEPDIMVRQIQEEREAREHNLCISVGPRGAPSFGPANGETDGPSEYEYPTFKSFYERIFFVGLHNAFVDEFGHKPTNNMNLWSNNREAERKAYWVLTGESPGIEETLEETRKRLRQIVSPATENEKAPIPMKIICGMTKELFLPQD